MPTRIIRDGIITSENVNTLSDKAELFYRRLMSVADDYGRYYSHPSLLRAACYPLKLNSVSEKDVKQMLSECVAAGVIVLYNDKNNLFIPKFRQQTRSKSKFPEPTENELLSKCEAEPKQMLSLVGVGDVVEDVGVVGADAAKKPTLAKANSLKEIEDYCQIKGLPPSDALYLWEKWNANGWRNGNDKIRDWQGTIRTWKAGGFLPSQKAYGRPQAQPELKPILGRPND